MIRTIGVEYLGLNSLFTSVLQVLNLAELGVGSAMVFSMYKPIADDNEEKICALIQLYKKYYRIIGSIILVIGLICTPFIPKLIHGVIPNDMNVYVLYLMNLSVTVLTYWMFAYKSSVLQAHQRHDVISKVNIFTFTFKYILQLIALVVFHSYYIYVIARIITQIITNIFTALASHKYYPNLNAKGKLDSDEVKSINQRIKDLFTSKLGGTIVNSADTIVISAFLGLEILAVYQNYYYVISSIMAFIAIINSSVVAGVGNSILTNSIEENYKEFKVFTFLQMWIIGFCVCCFSSLFQPFMKLWMGEKLLLPYTVVILLCAVFAGVQLVQMLSVYKDAGGIWHEDRFRPLASGLANLVINVILVNIIGIYGIVISTVLSVFCISLPWIISNVFNLIFKTESIKQYILRMVIWFGTISAAVIITNIICALINNDGVLFFIIKALISVVIPNLCFALAFHRSAEYKKCIDIFKRMVHLK